METPLRRRVELQYRCAGQERKRRGADEFRGRNFRLPPRSVAVPLCCACLSSVGYRQRGHTRGNEELNGGTRWAALDGASSSRASVLHWERRCSLRMWCARNRMVGQAARCASSCRSRRAAASISSRVLFPSTSLV